jgi:hypothetical protein
LPQQPVKHLGYPFLLMGMQTIGTIFIGIRGHIEAVDSRKYLSQ